MSRLEFWSAMATVLFVMGVLALLKTRRKRCRYCKSFNMKVLLPEGNWYCEDCRGMPEYLP